MVPMRLGCCCAAMVIEVAATAAALVPPPAGPSSLVPCTAVAAAWLASAASDDRSAPPDAPRRAADAILPNMMAESRVESFPVNYAVSDRSRGYLGTAAKGKMMKQANDWAQQSSKSNRKMMMKQAANDWASQIAQTSLPVKSALYHSPIRRGGWTTPTGFHLIWLVAAPISVGLHLGTGGHHIALGIPRLVCTAALDRSSTYF